MEDGEDGLAGGTTGLWWDIWDAQAWQSYQERHEDEYSQAQNEVLPGIF